MRVLLNMGLVCHYRAPIRKANSSSIEISEFNGLMVLMIQSFCLSELYCKRLACMSVPLCPLQANKISHKCTQHEYYFDF